MVQTLSTSPNSTREGIHHLKLTTKREELVSKLSTVSRAVSTRAATQALSGVLLTASEGQVTLAATDLDLGLQTSLAAEVESAGIWLATCDPIVPASGLSAASTGVPA